MKHPPFERVRSSDHRRKSFENQSSLCSSRAFPIIVPRFPTSKLMVLRYSDFCYTQIYTYVYIYRSIQRSLMCFKCQGNLWLVVEVTFKVVLSIILVCTSVCGICSVRQPEGKPEPQGKRIMYNKLQDYVDQYKYVKRILNACSNRSNLCSLD